CFGIVVEQFAVPSPTQHRIQLALDLLFGLMFIQNVPKELQGNAVIGLLPQRLVNLLEEQDAGEGSLAEDFFLLVDTVFNLGGARRRDLDVAFLQVSKPQQHSRVDNWKKVVHFHQQLSREVIEVFAAAAVDQNLQQSGDTAGVRVWQQRVPRGRMSLARSR